MPSHTRAGGRTWALLHRDYAIDRQRVFGEEVAAAIGFDFQRGRIDATTHPFFSTIGPGDCRITTRYSTHNFSDAFFGMLHEAGTACTSRASTPSTTARLWARRRHWACTRRSRVCGKTRSAAAGPSGSISSPALARSFTRRWRTSARTPSTSRSTTSRRSLNRVQADEVTYNLHILIRFELEQALIAGDLSAADVPAAWNEAYRHYLGVLPANDAEGCLQDGHWGAGMIGYFRLTRSVTCSPPSSSPGRRKNWATWARSLRAASLAACSAGCARKCTGRASRYPRVKLIEQVTGSPPESPAAGADCCGASMGSFMGFERPLTESAAG